MKKRTSHLLGIKKGGGTLVGTVLICIAVIAMVAVVQISLHVLRSLPGHYYNLLPVSGTLDIDRDGIPDYIDDSDGDGIADQTDVKPYGADVDIFELRTKSMRRAR